MLFGTKDNDSLSNVIKKCPCHPVDFSCRGPKGKNYDFETGGGGEGSRCVHTKRVYPQSDGSLAIVDIDASKWFVDLCVHLTFAIFAIFHVKRQLKLLEMACDQVQTCLIFPLRWAGFLIKIGRNAQWEHLFSMYFDDFLTDFALLFHLKVHFR